MSADDTLSWALSRALQWQHVPEWWNWQTRRTQNPVGLTARVGSSPSSGTSFLNVRAALPPQLDSEITPTICL
jgi:hypothetical protein